MLSAVRNILLNTPTPVDNRLESLKLVSNADILVCLNIIAGFGTWVCLNNRIGTIKTLRRLAPNLGLKHAKDMVEVLAEACDEGGSDTADILIKEIIAMF